MKTCTGCKETKGFTEFNRQSSSKDGYRPKCKMCRKADSKAYYDANKERIMEYVSDWRSENPDKVAQYNRVHKDSGKKASNDRRYAQEKPEVRRAAQAGYRARKYGAIDPDNPLPRDFKHVLLNFYGDTCLVPDCTNKANTVDHVVPLAKGGMDVLWNLQPMCNRHNSGKRDFNTNDYRTGSVIFARVVTV